MLKVSRDEVWKLYLIITAIVAAITAHAIKLPPAWEPAMPYVEFLSGVFAVVTAISVKPGGTDGK